MKTETEFRDELAAALDATLAKIGGRRMADFVISGVADALLPLIRERVAQARAEEAQWWSRRTVTYGLDNGCASLEEEQKRLAALQAALEGKE